MANPNYTVDSIVLIVAVIEETNPLERVKLAIPVTVDPVIVDGNDP